MKTPLEPFIYLVRNLLSLPLFRLLTSYVSGDVLDVGGGEFYKYLPATVRFSTWTVIEPYLSVSCRRINEIILLQKGFGENLPYPDFSFDTVLSIQVLEHVPDPYRVVSEMLRVLKDDGHLIVMVPQTSSVHLAPHHYYNFTKYWLLNLPRHFQGELRLITCIPIGGLWLSTASRMFYFFHHIIFPVGTTSDVPAKRLLFWFLLPFSSIAAFCILILSLILSVADQTDEPNNHIAVFVKV